MNPLRPRHRRIGHGAFTVIELMVAVSILTLIVLALFSMFDQTQKALRGNAAQVDVLEGGRTAMELLSREIEQMVAAVDDNDDTNGPLHLYMEHTGPPLRQKLAGTNAWRANVLSDLYFLTCPDRQTWTAIGYRVLSAQYVDQPGNKGSVLVTNVALGGYGFLARMSVSTNRALATSPTNLWLGGMMNQLALTTPAALSRYQRVVDGVVHFRLRMLDSQGQSIPSHHGGSYRGVSVGGLWNECGIDLLGFRAGVLPASVEVELGILEPQAVEHLASLTSYSARTNYLAKQASRVHLFQQRIPIRNAKTILSVTP